MFYLRAQKHTLAVNLGILLRIANMGLHCGKKILKMLYKEIRCLMGLISKGSKSKFYNDCWHIHFINAISLFLKALRKF